MAVTFFKALALGTEHCWVDRIHLCGLAHNGAKGVCSALNIIHDKIRTVMALMACNTVKDIRQEAPMDAGWTTHKSSKRHFELLTCE